MRRGGVPRWGANPLAPRMDGSLGAAGHVDQARRDRSVPRGPAARRRWPGSPDHLPSSGRQGGRPLRGRPPPCGGNRHRRWKWQLKRNPRGHVKGDLASAARSDPYPSCGPAARAGSPRNTPLEAAEAYRRQERRPGARRPRHRPRSAARCRRSATLAEPPIPSPAGRSAAAPRLCTASTVRLCTAGKRQGGPPHRASPTAGAPPPSPTSFVFGFGVHRNPRFIGANRDLTVRVVHRELYGLCTATVRVVHRP